MLKIFKVFRIFAAATCAAATLNNQKCSTAVGGYGNNVIQYCTSPARFYYPFFRCCAYFSATLDLPILTQQASGSAIPVLVVDVIQVNRTSGFKESVYKLQVDFMNYGVM